MKYLIIAEKPSVATDLSKALAGKLGKFSKKGKSRDAQYFENDNAAITSAVGHLVELKMPTGPNGKNLPWKFDVLPAIPKTFPKSSGRSGHQARSLRCRERGRDRQIFRSSGGS
jgi:DNA topoisomerase-3